MSGYNYNSMPSTNGMYSSVLFWMKNPICQNYNVALLYMYVLYQMFVIEK